MVPAQCLTVLAFALSLATVYARYCSSEEKCCPFPGMNKPSCHATGTSDAADVLYRLTGNSSCYMLIGRKNDIFGFYSIVYHYDEGSQLVVNMQTLYAYIFDIPPTIYRGRLFLAVYVTGCTYFEEIKECSTGYIEGTNYKKDDLFYALTDYSDSYYPAGCSLAAANNLETYNEDITNFAQRVNVFLYLSGINALRVHPLNFKTTPKDYNIIMNAAKRCPELRLDYAECHCTSVNRGYSKNQTCNDPNPNETIGNYLASISYDFSGVLSNRVGAGCAMFSTIAYYLAQRSSPIIFTFARISFLKPSYKYVFQLNVLLFINILYNIFRAFCRACA